MRRLNLCPPGVHPANYFIIEEIFFTHEEKQYRAVLAIHPKTDKIAEIMSIAECDNPLVLYENPTHRT